MTSTLSPSRPRVRALPSAVLVGLTTTIAFLTILAGATHAVTAATSPYIASAPVAIGPAAPGFSIGVLPCVEGWPMPDGSTCMPAAAADEWPGGEGLPVSQPDTFSTGAAGMSWTTGLLASADLWVGLLAAGAAALVLVPTLRSTAAGRPFARHNDHRLLIAASVVATGWLLATVGPYAAAHQVIFFLETTPYQVSSLPITLPHGWLVPSLHVTWWPALVVALLAVLAAATRAGARLADDSDGLV